MLKAEPVEHDWGALETIITTVLQCVEEELTNAEDYVKSSASSRKTEDGTKAMANIFKAVQSANGNLEKLTQLANKLTEITGVTTNDEQNERLLCLSAEEKKERIKKITEELSPTEEKQNGN